MFGSQTHFLDHAFKNNNITLHLLTQLGSPYHNKVGVGASQGAASWGKRWLMKEKLLREGENSEGL